MEAYVIYLTKGLSPCAADGGPPAAAGIALLADMNGLLCPEVPAEINGFDVLTGAWTAWGYFSFDPT